MKIESTDKTVTQLLQSSFYKIPRFQRPYSWEVREVEDFWQDTIVDSDSDYFIGSIVLFKAGDDTFGIVDGQQRLTTITMLLSAIRNALGHQQLKPMAKGLHGLIERKDIDNKKQFILQTETSYPYLQTEIQGWSSGEGRTPVSEEETRLAQAFQLISQKVHSIIESIQQNESLSEKSQKKEIEKRLRDVRDKILRLACVVVVLDSEEDAYVIFETLNTRGKDLALIDLVKTHVTKLLPSANRNVDRPKEKFNEIRTQFDEAAVEIDPDAFVLHFWLSRYEYTAKKKIFRQLKRKIKRDDASAFLSTLVSDAKTYRVIHEPAVREWRIEELAIRDALYALLLFRVQQPLPFVLSVVRGYLSGDLGAKLAIRAVKAVENFHLVFTSVTSQRSSGGISAMYALHARELQAQNDGNGRSKVIDALVSKLRDRRPSFDEFVPYFRELKASEVYAKQKKIVQYILARMSREMRPQVPLDPAKMTIEHLANQSHIPTGLTPAEVAEIGNLVWVPDTLQAKLGVKPVEEKIRILKDNNVWLDDFLSAHRGAWTAKTIRARTDKLARDSFDAVWKL
jgi:uncharacterized protein with ParB-like and HNH nuclease domain